MQLSDAPVRSGLRFAASLRAIGEDLADISPQSFELRVAEGDYIVRGVRKPAKAGDGKGAKFARRYTAEDIARLDRRGRERKTGAVTMPDPGTLREALRIIGGLIDAQRGRLVRLVKEERKIVFEYIDSSGSLRHEERYALGIYRAQQEAATARAALDMWTDSKV